MNKDDFMFFLSDFLVKLICYLWYGKIVVVYCNIIIIMQKMKKVVGWK